jgi:hypothetical protein
MFLDSKKEIDDIANQICPDIDIKKRPKFNFLKKFKRKATRFFPQINHGTLEKNSFRKLFSKDCIIYSEEKNTSNSLKVFNNLEIKKENELGKERGNKVLNKLCKNKGIYKADTPEKAKSPISNIILTGDRKTSE